MGKKSKSSTIDTAHASSSKSLKNVKKRVLEPASQSKANLKKQKIHKEKFEENDEDEIIVSKKEFKEMTKSIKELSKGMKKLPEILLPKADLLEVSSKEKETPKQTEEETYTCNFDCKEAKGNNDRAIFVKGFERLRRRDEIKNTLTNIFSSCGKVTRVYVPVECKTHVPLGFAFINLRNGKGNEKALELNGRYMGGRELEVTMAKGRAEVYGFTNFNGCARCVLHIRSLYTDDHDHYF